MILTVDIGNTNIVLGGFVGEEPTFVARLSTDTKKTEDEYAAVLRSVLSIHAVEKKEIRGAIIASVVPPLNSIMKKAIRIVYGIESVMVGPGIKTGLGIHCDNPATVGADLISGCVAANELYGAPALVIDMGTATKMMLVDEKGTFCGASIIPGVTIGLSALSGGTAQLPQISLEAPPSVIGKNTVDCMRSGVVYGNACLIDGMIDRFFEATGTKMQVIATGGLSGTIIPLCTHKITVDDHLVLKGLRILYEKNR